MILLNAARQRTQAGAAGNGASSRMLAFRDDVHQTVRHHGQKSGRVQAAREVPPASRSCRRRKPGSSRRTATASRRRWSHGGDRAQRRAHARGRCLHVERSQADCRLVEALGGAKQPPQGRSIPLRALHAHLLHQSRRQKSAAGAQEDIDAGEGRSCGSNSARTSALRSLVELHDASCAGASRGGGSRRASGIALAFFIRPQSSSPGAAWEGAAHAGRDDDP